MLYPMHKRALLFVLVALAGCSLFSNREKFIGSWHQLSGDTVVTWEFRSDDTFSARALGYLTTGEWSVTGDKLLLAMDIGHVLEFEYEFRENGDLLLRSAAQGVLLLTPAG